MSLRRVVGSRGPEVLLAFRGVMLCMALNVAVVSATYIDTACLARAVPVLQANVPITAWNCGSDECPPNVDYTATLVDQADLQAEGWFAYCEGGKLYTSPLNKFEPVEVPNAGSAYGQPVYISDSGKWILYGNNKIIQRDGSGLLTGLIPLNTAVFYRASPKGSEIAWIQGSDVRAKEINLDGNTVTTGTTRDIAKGLTIYKEYFCVGGESIISQTPSYMTDSWGYKGNIYDAGIWKIPNGGNGTASQSDMYRHIDMAAGTCGMTVSPDGKLTAGNYGHIYMDCFPENHHGFAVGPMKPLCANVKDVSWIHKDSVFVRFCPPEFLGQSLWVGKPPDNEFQSYNWTNHMDWIAVMHKSGQGNTTKGAWLVNWKTNEWTLLTNPTTAADKVAVYVTKYQVGVGQGSRSRVVTPAHTRARSLAVWRDLTGRRVAGRGTGKGLPAAIRVSEDGVRIETGR